MNGLEEVQEFIQKFICEKQEIQQQIAKIENQRTKLAEQRNRMKKSNSNCAEIDELGRQISELGNQSQEIQNQLDFKIRAVKTQVSSLIDNLIAEGIRKIRLCNDEIQELEEENEKQKEIRCLEHGGGSLCYHCLMLSQTDCDKVSRRSHSASAVHRACPARSRCRCSSPE